MNGDPTYWPSGHFRPRYLQKHRSHEPQTVVPSLKRLHHSFFLYISLASLWIGRWGSRFITRSVSIYWAKESPLPGRQAQSLVKLCPLAQQVRFFKFKGKLIFSIKIRFLLQPQGCIIMQRLVVIIYFFKLLFQECKIPVKMNVEWSRLQTSLLQPVSAWIST